eukprot:CAMPEP_0182502308 /NCGR_PEP_ID=MMETSP1321-20130603/13134_1 /TAXON_ID=91990 /ORGANISM="Bolidomonas sp., Strain RCC1657" /LENGTH=106 /DNA_ID=CAMNT_0024707171 /DNA_START=264 /DNA_END=585 /DNA_ORIENTATION=+
MGKERPRRTTSTKGGGKPSSDDGGAGVGVVEGDGGGQGGGENYVDAEGAVPASGVEELHRTEEGCVHRGNESVKQGAEDGVGVCYDPLEGSAGIVGAVAVLPVVYV